MNEIPYEYIQGGGYFGPKFTGVFLFENIFWRVVIPIVIGTPSVNTVASLVAMPDDFKRRLIEDVRKRELYKAYWADCLDYDQGRHYFSMEPPKDPAVELVASVDRDLLSTISDLAQPEPNANAMHNARLATEKAMKAFLCLRHSMTIAAVRKDFQHDLGKLAAEVVKRDPQSEMAELVPEIGNFASYSDRYADRPCSRLELWAAYRCAQFAASALMRALTPYNQRAAMGLDRRMNGGGVSEI